VVLGEPGYAAGFDDAIAVDEAQPLPAVVAQAERALLRWLECRVEQRYPDALVGINPRNARLLQWLARMKVPLLNELVQGFHNCAFEADLRAPILMPHPFGIVIERGAQIGNRVTIMQQVAIGATPEGAPVIEDAVYLGPGAKVSGRVRVGRGARIGPNAVVTRDVPSHCTVVGINHLLSPRDDGFRKKVS
jgi:serine acetyltransferase